MPAAKKENSQRRQRVAHRNNYGWLTIIHAGQRTIDMRKVVAGLFISLDGVVEAPYQWQFDDFDDDMMAAMEAHLAAEDTILLGE